MIKKPVLIIIILFAVLFPTESREWMNFSLDEPSPGFASNSVGDIVYMDLPGGGRVIWVGTGNGLSQSTDGGVSWVTYNQKSGLNRNDISALAKSDTTLWLAAAYNMLVEGEPVPYGRGFNKSDDLGKSWDSFIPEQVDFAGKVAYDIAIDDTTVWAACWYGGLIRSQNGGQTWENVFVDSFTRNDYEGGYYQYLSNRFFSVVVDTFCPIEKKQKNSINDIYFDGKLIWVATQNGLHASIDLGNTWFPYDTVSGLNSNGVYCMTGDTSFFWVGLYQEEKTYPLPLLPSLTGADFNFTTNYGATWDASRPSQGQASSFKKFALDMALVDTVIWAACGEGGLIRSSDRGQTWENVFVDDSARIRFDEGALEDKDIFTSLAVDTFDVYQTNIWAGTRNGIYEFIFTGTDSDYTVFPYLYKETGGPCEIVSIGVQRYGNSSVVWVAGDTTAPFTFKSSDGGENWNPYLDGIQSRDFAFLDSTVWVATHEGLKRSKDGGESWDNFEIIDSTTGELVIPSYFTSVCVVKDTADTIIFVGSVDGLARSKDDGITWQVTKFAPSFKTAIWAGTAAGIYKFIYNYRDGFDTVLNYNSYEDNITGDWVVSLAVQEQGGKKIIWAGTRVAYSGQDGASFSTDDGDTWNTTLLDDQVWNFSFDDSVVWTATSSGLKRSHDEGKNWEVFNFMKDKDEITQNRIFSSEFTSVAIIDSEVWAGNAEGLVKSLDKGNSWDVIRMAVPIGTEGTFTAYAYPSPFSPIVEGGQVVRIHHRPRQDGPVTIKIYDFAMNLVITLINQQDRRGGMEYDEPWNGNNEKGELVANGVYFFKLEAPGGQTEWGKLVVLK
jgi:photosystem II stability/assembly factor-like uncharacterized protein